MATNGPRTAEQQVVSLAARALELEAKLVEIETTSVAAADGVELCKRTTEGTNVAVERIGGFVVHDQLQAELATVRRAEAKLALGSEGRCDGCGVMIPEERLEAVPWAVRCVGCAD